MAPDEFAIRKRVKYGEEWDWEETRAWMKETKKAWTEDFNKADEDYKRYRKSDFASLEESIAINLFGITDDLAKRAYRGTCLLRYFSKDQRLVVTRTRKKMEEISGSQELIEMQIIPIAARMDEDLKRIEGEGEKERLIKEQNKITGRIFVFRVKDSKGNPVFLDAQLRKYKTWKKYLSNNTSPQCIYCYPKDGFLRKKTLQGYVANDVEFGEPPSCKLLKRMKKGLDTVILCVSPIVAIGAFWCPASWVMTASVFGVASQGLLLYNLASQGYQLLDQIEHGEDYGASLMTFITSIGTMIINKGLNRYLRGIAQQGRQLTTLESVVITGFLLGMKGSQVASWAWMTVSLACKPKLEPMDFVSYCVALHNLYSCVSSPWTAGQLLNSVKAQILGEHQKAVDTVKREKDSLDQQGESLEALRASGAAPEVIAQAEAKFQTAQAKFQRLEAKVLADQKDFLDKKGEMMKDEQARAKYGEFREDAMNDPEQRGQNTEVDQNGRIIKAVMYMDAEMVFKTVSMTQSTIRFSNGETMDLLINSQLDIHPAALNQMNRITEVTDKKTKTTTKYNDLEKMMKLTKAYTGKEIKEKDYLRDIGTCLKDYKMITRLEIQKVKNNIATMTTDQELTTRFANMTPAEALRMRTVLLGTDKRTLDHAYRMAKALGNNNENMTTAQLANWVEVAKLEFNHYQQPTAPEATRDRWTEYYQQVKEWEIAGLMKDGRSAEDARRIADENYLKRENIKAAQENDDQWKVANMTQVCQDNHIDRRFLKYREQNFEAWNAGGTKGDHFFRAFNDQATFDARMNDMRIEINKVSELAAKESQTMPNAIAAYYHVRKHGHDSRKHFNKMGWDIPRDQQDLQYFTTEKNHIIKDGLRGWWNGIQQEKFVSQDGSTMTTLYRDGKGYFGVTKCPYDVDLGREVGKATVASHFPK